MAFDAGGDVGEARGSLPVQDRSGPAGDHEHWRAERRLGSGLYLHLTTRQAVDPATVAEWSASEEGHRFLTASSDAWHEASVAFSTDPAEARAAADCTAEFYTGASGPASTVTVLRRSLESARLDVGVQCQMMKAVMRIETSSPGKSTPSLAT